MLQLLCGLTHCAHQQRGGSSHFQAVGSELPRISAPSDFINPVTDRPGPDRGYAIDPNRISFELRWQLDNNVERELDDVTVCWYLSHQEWCRNVHEREENDVSLLEIGDS